MKTLPKETMNQVAARIFRNGFKTYEQGVAEGKKRILKEVKQKIPSLWSDDVIAIIENKKA
ncbi:MAG: hypothetical protein Q8R36_03815 [bacterium]|nr:hypothetical protein [bacterium]